MRYSGQYKYAPFHLKVYIWHIIGISKLIEWKADDGYSSNEIILCEVHRKTN